MRLPSAPLLLLLASILPSFVVPANAQTACTGLCLQQVSCPTGQTTSISGVVYAPNGTDPLPNVLVYIPNAPVDAFTPGVSCPIPGAPPSGSPLVGATTAVDGSFKLVNVPVSMNGVPIPVVIQTGRWRRQLSIVVNNQCADNALVGARFPRNQTEGDIPKIAITTGSADSVECVLRKVGIDDTEFTDSSGPGRINLYPGSGSPGSKGPGTSTQTQADLMGNSQALNGYDVLMLPCEGSTYPNAKTSTEYTNLVNFANSGGRVYASHFSYQWMYQNVPFNTVANWGGGGAAVATGPVPATVDTTFSEGKTLAQWLQLVGASTTPGQVNIYYVKKDINSINPPTQSYLTLNSNNAVQQFVWDTPVGVTTNQCGRVLFNEYHVENPTLTSAGVTFPAECSPGNTTPQEKLLEFSLFELTADGNAATLTPLTQDFGQEPVNFTTGNQTFTWTNNSTFSSSVTLLNTTGDFKVTGSNCSVVAAGASCTITVAFAPTVLGARTGTLSVGSGASTLVATLTGTGIPGLTFSATSVTFGSQDVGASATQTFNVNNNAPIALSVLPFTATGDFAATTNCPGGLVPALGTCQVSVTFTPTVYGARTGTLVANATNYTGTPLPLAGNGLDYTVAMSPGSGTVIAGLSATTSVTTTPEGGFSSNLVLSCAVSAPGSTCSIAQTSYASASAQTSKVTITTTAQYAVIGYTGLGGAGWLWIVGLGTGGLLWFRRRSLGSVAKAGLLLVVLGVVSLSATGCSGKLPAQNPGYTGPGSYTYTITATDGFLSHSTTYALNVTAK